VEGWLRAVKAFVVVAGVLILLGTGTLVALLVARTGPRAVSLEAPARVAIPAGLRLVRASATGDRVLLELVDERERLHLLLVDAATGTPTGYLLIAPAP